MTKEEVVAILSDIRSGYNCFDADEEPKYRALSIAIKEFQKQKSDKIAKQILADMAGMSVNDDINAISNKLIFGKGFNENRTGRWTLAEMGDTDLYECSLCKTRKTYKPPFCPHCGAKMEGEDNEKDC